MAILVSAASSTDILEQTQAKKKPNIAPENRSDTSPPAAAGMDEYALSDSLDILSGASRIAGGFVSAHCQVRSDRHREHSAGGQWNVSMTQRSNSSSIVYASVSK